MPTPPLTPLKPQASMPAFAALAQGSSEALANRVNESELSDWLGAISQDRLGSALPEKGSRSCSLIASRADKAAAWLATVARKGMLREGASVPWSPSAAELAQAPAWAAKSLAAGGPLTQLLLSEAERSSLEGCLDWMMAPDGPNPASDWSKISLPQAIAGERAWIEALSLAEERRRNQADAERGEDVLVEVEARDASPERQKAPWRWMALLSPEALEREGSVMRNCIGKRYKTAGPELQFYSLRDMAGGPLLSAQVKSGEFREIKGFANEPCPVELAPSVARLVSLAEEINAAAGRAPMRYGRDFLNLGFFSAREGLPAGWSGDADWRQRWSSWARVGASATQLMEDYRLFTHGGYTAEAQRALDCFDWAQAKAGDFAWTKKEELREGSLLRADIERRMDPTQAFDLLWPMLLAGKAAPEEAIEQAGALARRLFAQSSELECSARVLRAAAASSEEFFTLALGRMPAVGGAPWDAFPIFERAMESSKFANAKVIWPRVANKNLSEGLLAKAVGCADPVFFTELLAGSDISASAGRLLGECAKSAWGASEPAMMEALFPACASGFDDAFGEALIKLAAKPNADADLIRKVGERAPASFHSMALAAAAENSRAEAVEALAPICGPADWQAALLATAKQSSYAVESKARDLLSERLRQSGATPPPVDPALIALAASRENGGFVAWALSTGGGQDLSEAFQACLKKTHTACARALLASGRVGAIDDSALELGYWNDDEPYARMLLARPGGAKMTESVLLNAMRLGSADFLAEAAALLPLGIASEAAAKILFAHGDLALANAFLGAIAPTPELAAAVARKLDCEALDERGLSMAISWAALREEPVSQALCERMALSGEAGVSAALYLATLAGLKEQMRSALAADPSDHALRQSIALASRDPEALGAILAHPRAPAQVWEAADDIIRMGPSSGLAALLEAIPPQRRAASQPQIDAVLRSAADSGKADMVRAALPWANANGRDRSGLTPLIRASITGDESAVEALIAVSDISATGLIGVFKGLDAEQIALKSGQGSIAKKLARAREAQAAKAACEPAAGSSSPR